MNFDYLYKITIFVLNLCIMSYVSGYLKERLTDVIIKGNLVNDILTRWIENNAVYQIEKLLVQSQIEKEIPIIKKHAISHYDGSIVIEFWYYLDSELVKDRLELDLKLESRNHKLLAILG